MYVCLCNGLTETDIRSCCVKDGARSLRDLECCLGVGSCCGKCKPAAKQILAETRAEPGLKLSGAPA